MNDISEQYMRDVWADIKANPTAEPGMHMAVYAHSDGRPFKGYGKVLDAWWSDFYCQWCAHIRMYDGSLCEHVLACNMERVGWRSSVVKSMLRVLVGGKRKKHGSIRNNQD